MRLIDADALWDELTEDLEDGDVLYRIPPSAIDNAPTVDAVPVVRCGKCRYYAGPGETTSFCIHPGGMKFTSDSDYCSRGKRRDQSADVRKKKGAAR